MAENDPSEAAALRSRVQGEAEFAAAVALGQEDRAEGRLILHEVLVQALAKVFEEPAREEPAPKEPAPKDSGP